MKYFQMIKHIKIIKVIKYVKENMGSICIKISKCPKNYQFGF